jgi:serine/threonine-protein kinase
MLLASRPGEIVTRAEIQKALWGDDTFIDFEHGINFSIKQIRDVLGDTADKPRFVDTVPRVGYRFIAKVDGIPSDERETLGVSEWSPAGLPRTRWKVGAVTIVVLAAAIVMGALVVSTLQPNASPPSDVRKQRFQISLPRDVAILSVRNAVTAFAISPDGDDVVFVGCPESAQPAMFSYVSCLLYLRKGSEIDAKPLLGTEGAMCPFFSPDGRWIAFLAGGRLKKINVERGIVIEMAVVPALRGGNWGEDGNILFSVGGGSTKGLSRIPADGGAIEEVTRPDHERGEGTHRWPHVLPGARAALFTVHHGGTAFVSGSHGFDVAIVDLKSRSRRTLIERASAPKYLNGHVLFGRDGILYSAPLDVDRLELAGAPVPVLEGVAMWSSPSGATSGSGNVFYDVSQHGDLLFSPREARLPRRTLILFDRGGTGKPLSRERRSFRHPIFSPDGLSIAVIIEDHVYGTFVVDTRSDAWTRVGDPNLNLNPMAWFPDGKSLLLYDGSKRVGRLLIVPLDGGTPSAIMQHLDWFPPSLSPDGSVLLYDDQPEPQQFDIWRLALDDHSTAPWLATPSVEMNPSFSPDGRWVAYRAEDSGQPEIYVRPYSGSGGRHRVSIDGGSWPRWSRDGTEIFFTNRESLWSAVVRTMPTFSSDPPRKLFDLSDDLQTDIAFYDVSPDGQHFVLVENEPFELPPPDLVVVPGWVEEMKARIATRN